MATKIQLRRDTASAWASANPVLAQGEIGFATDTKDFKFGDGSTPWNSLEAWSPNALDAAVAALDAAVATLDTSVGTLTNVGTGKLQPVRCATVGTETFTISSGSVTRINGVTVDGVSPAVGDRILVTGAPASTGTGSALSSQPGNGVYVVTGNTTNLSLSRAADMSSTGVTTPAGYSVDVMAGTVNGNATLRVKTPSSSAAFTWGTTAIQWGAANANATGGTLDGVTIGGTTQAVSVNAATFKQNTAVSLSGTDKPWLNQVGFYVGSMSTDSHLNHLAVNEEIVSGAHYLFGLRATLNSIAPATGLRSGIYGEVNILSAGTNTQASASYIGVTGRATIQSGLGGTGFGTVASGTYPIGSCFGGWFFAVGNTGTYLSGVCGVEIDVEVDTGVSVFSKVGLSIVNTSGDAVQGTVEDMALSISKQSGVTTSWKNGIMFGREQGSINSPSTTYQNWPFDSTSTMITAATHGAGTNGANIGIDFTNVTFTTAAIKTGAASIAMAEMASAPSTIASTGQFYVASDGSLHYLSPAGNDTQVAPA